MKSFAITLISLSAFLCSLQAWSQLAVTPTTDADILAAQVIAEGNGVHITNTTYMGTAIAAGIFSEGEFGLSEGILLTSGDVANAVGPNDSSSMGTDSDADGDNDLDNILDPISSNDACALEISFIPSGDTFEFTYVFASEEYNEFVCSVYNDFFAFFISGGIYDNVNIANIPGTDPPVPVAINNVNNGSEGANALPGICQAEQLLNSGFFVDNAGGANIQYDGYTVPLTASAIVEPGVEYTIKIVIADGGDGTTDSGVFIENLSFTSSGEEFDCPEFEANIGEPCFLEAEEGSLTEDCSCVLPQVNEDCNEFTYYLSDSRGGISDIYRVDISEGIGTLTLLKTVDFPAHIAYSQTDELLYLVRSTNGSFRALDVSVADGALSEETNLSTPLPTATAAAINGDNKLIIGGSDDDLVVLVDLATGASFEYTTAPVEGGDIAFGINGKAFLASRDGGYLYMMNPGVNNMVVENISTSVTGLTAMPDNKLLYSAQGSDQLQILNTSGSSTGESIQLLLDGEPFSHGAGDLASGCFVPNPTNEACTNFTYYYVANNTAGYSQGTIFEGSIQGDQFVLTEKFSTGFRAHIALNTTSGEIYAINGNGNTLNTYGPDGTLLADVSLSLSATYTLAWNPADGLVYAGSANANKVFTIDPISGTTVEFASNIPVQGGDLVFNEQGELFLIERNNNTPSILYNITSGEEVEIADLAMAINGAALTAENGFIAAMGNGNSSFFIYDSEGNELTELDAVNTEGDLMLLFDGDMASGCMDNLPSNETCDYRLYYTHQPNGQSFYALYELTLTEEGIASTNLLEENIGGAHIAITPDGGGLYIVSGSDLRFYDFSDGTLTTLGNIQTAEGQNLSGFPAAVCGADGVLYAAHDPSNQVYTIAPDGTASPFGPSVPISGGDLIIVDNDLWAVNRSLNKLLKVADGGVTQIDLNQSEANGAAVLPNGNILIANGNGEGFFEEISTTGESIASYLSDLELWNGDLAGRCIGPDPFNEENQGNCYASEMIQHTEGTTLGGGSIADVRNNPLEALGEPEGIDELVFVSLGYGGSITLGFNGAVPNMPGPDLEIIETTFNNSSCNSYPEYADVFVSNDGVNFFFAKTICRSDNLVDISSAADFTHITQVRIANSELSSTPDAFDLDGVIALHNCESIPSGEITQEETSQSNLLETTELKIFPNPSSGQVNIQLRSSQNERVTIEVLDINGKVLEQVFSGLIKSGESRRLDFQANQFAPGVYFIRLSSASQSEVEKILIID